MFEDKIEPMDILQGKLDDSYLLSALSSISEDDKRIRKMFVSDRVNREGIFAIYTFFGGERKQVVVDNFFPCKS